MVLEDGWYTFYFWQGPREQQPCTSAPLKRTVLNIPVLAIREVPRRLKVISSCFLVLGIVGILFIRLLPRH